MKKFLNFALMAVLAVVCALPLAGKAEAAKIAVVPLASNVENNTTLGVIYMEEVMNLFKFPDFDMVSEEDVDKAVGAKAISDFSQANLERIARETNADIVVAMSVDKFEDKSLFPRQEPTLQLELNGQFAFLNKITGKYFSKNYLNDTQIEEALTVRGDWKSEEFSRTVRSYLKKVDKIK